MTIMNRYLTRLFCTMAGITIPGLAGIYLLVYFIENVDDFLEANTPFIKIAEYFLLLLPGLIYETAPLAILLAALLSTMIITRNMEMLALRSSGIAPRTIAMPFFTTAAIFSVILLITNIAAIPQARSRAAYIKASAVSPTRTSGSLIGTRLFYRAPDSIIKAETITSNAARLKNVHWYFFSHDYALKGVITAAEAEFVRGTWRFHRGIATQGEDAAAVSFFKTIEKKLDVSPEDFTAVRKPPEEMDIPSLITTVMRLRTHDLPCSELETQLWGELLYPFLSVLLLMVGLPLTISRIKGAISISFGIGMAIGLSTWVLWNIAMVMGKSGAVPGFLAPLMVEGVVAGTGLFLMKKKGVLY